METNENIEKIDNIEYEILIFAKELVQNPAEIPEWAEFFARKGGISVDKATELLHRFYNL